MGEAGPPAIGRDAQAFGASCLRYLLVGVPDALRREHHGSYELRPIASIQPCEQLHQGKKATFNPSIALRGQSLLCMPCNFWPPATTALPCN